ncbi:MAG: YfiR family protein [Lacunisphaera sp.]
MPAFGASKEGAEYEVKAVFLLNFTRFVEWPADEAKATQPFVIAVLGEDPFGSQLNEAVRGEKFGNRPIEIKRIATAEDAASCGALFIARSEEPHLKNILRKFAGRPILTVSDIPDFAESGGMVEFVTEDSKIHFHINIDAAKAANLAVSAKLLRPAVIVKTRKTSLNNPATTLFPSSLLVDKGLGPSNQIWPGADHETFLN